MKHEHNFGAALANLWIPENDRNKFVAAFAQARRRGASVDELNGLAAVIPRKAKKFMTEVVFPADTLVVPVKKYEIPFNKRRVVTAGLTYGWTNWDPDLELPIMVRFGADEANVLEKNALIGAVLGNPRGGFLYYTPEIFDVNKKISLWVELNYGLLAAPPEEAEVPESTLHLVAHGWELLE